MDPTRKLFSNDLASNVAEQSDSAAPGPAVNPSGSSSDWAQTGKLTPDSQTGPATPGVTAPPPVAFGRYQVRNALGAGGFGTVYLGHDTQLDRPVAIKVLRGGRDESHAESDGFLKEARRLARLSHPGIVTVHDFGVHEGQLYIVSDYLSGPDLSEWLKHNSPSWHEAARVAAARRRLIESQPEVHEDRAAVRGQDDVRGLDIAVNG